MNDKTQFKEKVSKHKEELEQDENKMAESLDKIKQLPTKQRKKVLRALTKSVLLPKSFKEAAKELLSD